MTRNLHWAKSGFTLIEVALAIVVVAIGVLAVFALLSAGLDASAKAVADTQAAIFADDVFNGLRTKSLEMAQTGSNYWEVFWDDFKNENYTNLTVAANSAWTSGWEGSARTGYWKSMPPIKPGGVRTQIYRNITMRGSSEDTIVNNALRYNLDVRFLYPIDLIDQSTWGTNRAMVTLKVWDGEFGSTNNPLEFYSEFYNPGDL